MTNIAQYSVAKAFVAVVATAMIFSAFVAPAKAQTMEELQAQIAALMAQIAALQGATTPGSTGGSCTAIPAPLTIGAQNANVTALQNYLISAGEVIPAGATGYFGGQTKAALASWQGKNGVSPAVGYYGPITAAAMAAKCVPTTPTEPTTPTTPTDDDEEEDKSVTLRGEATLDSFEVNDPDETDIEENDRDVEIGEFVIEFTNGDANINRLDIALVLESENGSLNNSQPWDAFDTISLWVDGDKIAEIDASDEQDDYLDEDSGTLRFSNLGLIAKEDKEVVITVAATIQNGLDNEELDTWELFATGLRYFDADGVSTDERNFEDLDGTLPFSNGARFTIEEEGQDEELSFRLSSSNPDSTDIVVDDNSTTNDVVILAYDIEADEADIDIERLVVLVSTPGVDTKKVINDIEIIIDGQTITDESFGNQPGVAAAQNRTQYANTNIGPGVGDAVWYVFDVDNDVTVEENEKVKVEVNVDFRQQTGNYSNGQIIKASVTTTERNLTQAEGKDDLVAADFTGTAIGDEHTLVAEGIVADRDSFNDSFSTQGQDNTIGIFKLDFDITAVENEFYIKEFATTSALVLGTDGGLQFTVEGPATPDSVSAVLASTADEDTPGVFVVREGETERFTLTVTVDASVAGQHRVVLNEMLFSLDDDGVAVGPDGQVYQFIPVTDFRSDYGNINQI